MSIKRTKEVSRRRTPERDEAYGGKKEPERVYTWETDVGSHPPETFVAYAASFSYPKDARLMHKVFGAGIVTRVDGSKIEVLFKEGAKKLAHNPKGTEAPKPGAPEATTPPAPAPAPAAAPEAPAAPAPASAASALPELIMEKVVWAFNATPYASRAEFEAAVIAYHAKIVSTHEGRFDPAAVVLPTAKVVVGYEAVRGEAIDESLSTTLVADDPAGFRQGELLFKLHQALIAEDLADHHFFEGLSRSGESDPPTYVLLQGS